MSDSFKNRNLIDPHNSIINKYDLMKKDLSENVLSDTLLDFWAKIVRDPYWDYSFFVNSRYYFGSQKEPNLANKTELKLITCSIDVRKNIVSNWGFRWFDSANECITYLKELHLLQYYKDNNMWWVLRNDLHEKWKKTITVWSHTPYALFVQEIESCLSDKKTDLNKNICLPWVKETSEDYVVDDFVVHHYPNTLDLDSYIDWFNRYSKIAKQQFHDWFLRDGILNLWYAYQYLLMIRPFVWVNFTLFSNIISANLETQWLIPPLQGYTDFVAMRLNQELFWEYFFSMVAEKNLQRLLVYKCKFYISEVLSKLNKLNKLNKWIEYTQDMRDIRMFSPDVQKLDEYLENKKSLLIADESFKKKILIKNFLNVDELLELSLYWPRGMSEAELNEITVITINSLSSLNVDKFILSNSSHWSPELLYLYRKLSFCWFTNFTNVLNAEGIKKSNLALDRFIEQRYLNNFKEQILLWNDYKNRIWRQKINNRILIWRSDYWDIILDWFDWIMQNSKSQIWIYHLRIWDWELSLIDWGWAIFYQDATYYVPRWDFRIYIDPQDSEQFVCDIICELMISWYPVTTNFHKWKLAIYLDFLGLELLIKKLKKDWNLLWCPEKSYNMDWEMELNIINKFWSKLRLWSYARKSESFIEDEVKRLISFCSEQ